MSLVNNDINFLIIKYKNEPLLNIYLNIFELSRVLILLDGLDEVHAVGNLSNICQPAGHPEKPGIPGKGALTTEVTPLQFTQCLLSGSLLPGTTYLQIRMTIPVLRKKNQIFHFS